MTHDRLQSECFTWAWNEVVETRFLIHANFNSHAKWGAREITHLKSLGLVKGVFDLEFYWKNTLHVFDIKVGKDKFSDHQIAFQHQIEKHGGRGYEIRDLEQFKMLINNIVEGKI